MSWVFLLLAIVFEVSGTSFMKLAQGFTKLVPSTLLFLCYGLSLGALTLASKTIDVSVAYAVWSGLGTAFITVVGIICFKEPLTAVKLVLIVLIIIGVIGLHIGGEVHEARRLS